MFGKPITRVRGDGKRVALTFDDGPNPGATPFILDALRDRGVKATFFILGRHAEQWPELVRRVVGFEGQILWDKSKPDGTPRKLMDSSRLFALGWRPEVELENGIRLTYQDFLKQTGRTAS